MLQSDGKDKASSQAWNKREFQGFFFNFFLNQYPKNTIIDQPIIIRKRLKSKTSKEKQWALQKSKNSQQNSKPMVFDFYDLKYNRNNKFTV